MTQPNARIFGLLLVLALAPVLATALFAQPNQESFGQAVAVRANDSSDIQWIGNPTGHTQFALLWLFDDDGDLSQWVNDNEGDTIPHQEGCQGVFLPPHGTSGGAIDANDDNWDDEPSLGLSISIPTDAAFNAAFDDAGISRRRPFGHVAKFAKYNIQATVKPEDLLITTDMLECGCCELFRLCEAEGNDYCDDDSLGLLRNVGDGMTQAECEAFSGAEGSCPAPSVPVVKKSGGKRVAGR